MSESQDPTQHDDTPLAPALFGSGLSTVYDALGRLLAARDLEDAAVVVEIAPFGRQVLRAGRRPLRDDERGLLERSPGLYVATTDGEATADPMVADLMVTLTELALRHDVTRRATEQP